MGGRGDYLSSGGFKEYHYETADIIDGVKVLHFKDGNQKLPEFSNTSDKYLGTNSNGKIIQLRIYYDRHAAIDFDWGHSHDGSGINHVHVHEWVNGVRQLNPKPMMEAQIKKYGSLIRKANPDAVF